MHSSVSIGVSDRDSVQGINTASSNYSEFLWCSPTSNGSNLVSTDENYNIDSGSSYHRLNDQVSPIANSHSSYYDFHSHSHHSIQTSAGGGGLSLNIGNRSGNVNEHHHLGPVVGHHHLQPHQHYGHMVETIGSEAEECCSSGSGPGEYYVTAARSPTDSAYEMWNCHNNNTSSHLNHHGMAAGDGGTSVGHPSPEDPLLISPNDEDEDNVEIGGISRDANGGLVMTPRPTPRRRNTANKKERRRTMSINNAFADLRDCIPNVPADTKLSKIKTLRLATSYIAYLSDVLTGDDPSRTPAAFTAEISRKLARGDEKRKKELLMAELNNSNHHHSRSNSSVQDSHNHYRKTKGRTGWPQHVWALELQQ